MFVYTEKESWFNARINVHYLITFKCITNNGGIGVTGAQVCNRQEAQCPSRSEEETILVRPPARNLYIVIYLHAHFKQDHVHLKTAHYNKFQVFQHFITCV